MSADPRPVPLVPADVDLRDFGFMPLDVLRLRDSDLAALASGDEFKAAVLLWCVAWHQVPAASLPPDDRLLARYSGAGAGWRKVKTEALRGFVECSDGRLYHATIAEKAIESWQKKLAQRERTAAATAAREAKRRAADAARDDQRNDQRDGSRDDQRDVQRNVVQGTVKGQGQGEGIEREVAQTRAASASPPSRGSRLPPDWTPGPEHEAFAESLGFRNGAATAELAKFRDYWAAQPGEKGRKADWIATWRNWLRRASETRATRPATAALDLDGVH